MIEEFKIDMYLVQLPNGELEDIRKKLTRYKSNSGASFVCEITKDNYQKTINKLVECGYSQELDNCTIIYNEIYAYIVEPASVNYAIQYMNTVNCDAKLLEIYRERNDTVFVFENVFAHNGSDDIIITNFITDKKYKTELGVFK